MGYSLNYNRLVALMAQMENLYLLDEWRKKASHNNKLRAKGKYGFTKGRPIALKKGSM
jgi:hypothetical protein